MNSHLTASAIVYTVPPLWQMLPLFGYFVGLSAAIGTTVTYAAVVRPALRIRGNEGGDVETLRRRTATSLAWAGVLLDVTAYFQLAAFVAQSGKGAPYGDALEPGQIWAFMSAPAKPGNWVSEGTLFLVQSLIIVLTSALLIALFSPRARRRLDWLALTALPFALAATLIRLVPAAPFATTEALLNKVFLQTHIVSGCTWLGGLALLVVLAGTRRSLSDRAGLLWADMWRRFGFVALISVGAALISGLWLTWQHIGSIPQLWTTTNGVILLVKIILVLGMITAGAVNSFWLMPRIALAREADPTASLVHLTLRHFPKVVWTEVALGTGVLTAITFFNGSARAEATGQGAPPVDPGLIIAGAVFALTLAASLYASAKASDALARRRIAAHAATATARPEAVSQDVV
ncbi:CopD family protein [Arthrobacter bambusae]|uniref:Copper transport protein n=1 Tax=Arthrobacter bambusae TaxID=1338426 RepID=A0AAW8DHH8_9MICC|nr:CopD family protein [Arthrobacter bambusae]MDP9907235.1 copper transport protein [Arthrobacter bambusae]MDQ0131372.1 copper transport protein [Arthrobacter bambusae]MDQ0182705.1 copper transport protein [Arthrobacter bambusae]